MKKIVKHLVYIILSLICSIFMLGCGSTGRVQITEEIENQNSMLIKYLVQRKDFNDSQWVWVFETTSQKNSLPSLENFFLVDEATRGLKGYYGEKENLFEVWHTLSCYPSSAPTPVLDFKFESNYQPFEASLLPVGNDFVSSCKKSDYQIVCESVARYGKISSRLIVDISNTLTEESSLIVNLILSNLNSRLQSTPDCHNQ